MSYLQGGKRNVLYHTRKMKWNKSNKQTHHYLYLYIFNQLQIVLNWIELAFCVFI